MRIQQWTLAVGLALGSGAVLADAPPVGTWVALQVKRCEAVTFKAHGPMDTPGERYRTTQITGQVVDAGFQQHDPSQAWLAQWVQEHQALLPAKGQSMTVVLGQEDAAFCRSAKGRVKYFDHAYTCDTLPRHGACLAPHPLVRPGEPK